MATSALLYGKYIEELNLDLQDTDSLTNKIKICSYLVCCGASVELESYPVHDEDFRTGNAGLQLMVGSPHLRALIPFLYMERGNPVKVRGDYTAKQAVVEYEGRELFEVDILPDFETGNENINLEFDTLIAAIPEEPYGNRSCYYHVEGKPCAFCILGEKKIDLGPPYLVQAYEAIRNEAVKEPQVLLTGGTESAEDRGLAKYIPYIEELKGRFKEARIAIEAAPPMNTSCLDPLIDLGMDTFAANMEFYSPECRDRLLPGKSSIPLDDYRNVLTYCNDAGVKTFSAVIAGPESETDTLNGVRFLAELGVPTNLLCVRPFPGASLENHPRVNPAWFLQLTKKAVRIMDEYGVLESLASTAGCGSCGACAMEMNLYRLMKNGQAEDTLDLL